VAKGKPESKIVLLHEAFRSHVVQQAAAGKDTTGSEEHRRMALRMQGAGKIPSQSHNPRTWEKKSWKL